MERKNKYENIVRYFARIVRKFSYIHMILIINLSFFAKIMIQIIKILNLEDAVFQLNLSI